MRRIIQVAVMQRPTLTSNDVLVVLCSDGTLWTKRPDKWEEIDTKQFDHDFGPTGYPWDQLPGSTL